MSTIPENAGRADVRFDAVEKRFNEFIAMHPLNLEVPRGCFSHC